MGLGIDIKHESPIRGSQARGKSRVSHRCRNAECRREAEARDRLGTLAARASAATDVNTAVVINGHVAQALPDFAAQTKADLIAVTMLGRGASRLLVGSIADKILRGGKLPVLIRRLRDG
ncbi:MAG TPA: universal stress protein [Gemmatimonadaceae bacterium]